MQYIRALVVAWIGNLVGAVFSAFVFSFSTGVLAEEPYRSGIVAQITMNIVEAQWHIILIRAIGCGFLVCFSSISGVIRLARMPKRHPGRMVRRSHPDNIHRSRFPCSLAANSLMVYQKRSASTCRFSSPSSPLSRTQLRSCTKRL